LLAIPCRLVPGRRVVGSGGEHDEIAIMLASTVKRCKQIMHASVGGGHGNFVTSSSTSITSTTSTSESVTTSASSSTSTWSVHTPATFIPDPNQHSTLNLTVSHSLTHRPVPNQTQVRALPPSRLSFHSQPRLYGHRRTQPTNRHASICTSKGRKARMN
jgi:hypothetical protein